MLLVFAALAAGLLPGLLLAALFHRALWRITVNTSLRQAVCAVVSVAPELSFFVFRHTDRSFVDILFDRYTLMALCAWLPFALILEATWQNRIKSRAGLA